MLETKQYYATKNACYLTNQTIVPKGIMVHSTGANNPNLSRYVGPDDGLLGPNRHGNHWNIYHPGGKDIGVHPYKANGHGRCETCGGRQVGVHAFIGKLKDGTIAGYQLLPWNHRAWHGGKAQANDTLISFEICEDGLADPVYFNQVYDFAVRLCADLCKQFKLTEKDIIDHSEGFKKGIASNHADVGHWFPRHGKSMNTFREDVKKGLVVSPVVKTIVIPRTVRKGDKGIVVKQLQKALTKAGYPCGKIDGDFGEKTLTAVLAFQNFNKLTADGVVGAKTWTKLL